MKGTLQNPWEQLDSGAIQALVEQGTDQVCVSMVSHQRHSEQSVMGTVWSVLTGGSRVQ